MILCLAQQPNSDGEEAQTPPASTAAVNEAIQIFAELLPLQDLSSMTKTVSQLVEATASAKVEKNSGRKAAVLINSAIALVLALRNAATHSRQLSDTLGNSQVSAPLAELLKVWWSFKFAGLMLTSRRLCLSMEIFSFERQAAKR